jgi:hypothetical protein
LPAALSPSTPRRTRRTPRWCPQRHDNRKLAGQVPLDQSAISHRRNQLHHRRQQPIANRGSQRPPRMLARPPCINAGTLHEVGKEGQDRRGIFR